MRELVTVRKLSPRKLHLSRVSATPSSPSTFSLLFFALSSRSFYQRPSRSARARAVQIPGLHIGPCWRQTHPSPRLIFTIVRGFGRGVVYPSYGLSSNVASPLTRDWSRTGIAPGVEAPVVAPRGVPVTLLSTENVFGAVPMIAIVANVVVKCFGALSLIR